MSVHRTQLQRQAQHYAAVRARLLGDPKRVMLKLDVQPEHRLVRAARKMTTREQQNEFIKNRCQQLRVRYKSIMAEHMPARVMTVRDQILFEIKKRWPKTNNKRLAELFQRSEKGILAIMAKHKIKSEDRPITPEIAALMRQMRADGSTQKQIAQEFGVGRSTVRYHLGKKESA